jgi:hypothetical protein
MSDPDFCLRSLSSIQIGKVFSEALLHFLSHHRGCGRTIICFTGLFFSSKSGLAQPLGPARLESESIDVEYVRRLVFVLPSA